MQWEKNPECGKFYQTKTVGLTNKLQGNKSNGRTTDEKLMKLTNHLQCKLYLDLNLNKIDFNCDVNLEPICEILTLTGYMIIT